MPYVFTTKRRFQFVNAMNAFKQSDSQPTLDTSQLPPSQQERFQQIELKLDLISSHKQAQQQQQLQENLIQRVQSLEHRSAEQARQMENHLQHMRKQLNALVLEEKEMNSRRQRGFKIRAAAIKELKGKLGLLTEEELQEGKQESQDVMAEAEQKVEMLENQVGGVTKERKYGIQKLQAKISQGLSRLHQHIETADTHAHHQLNTLATDAHRPLQALTQQIHSARKQQQSSHHSLLCLISSTISSLQSEIEQQRSARSSSHTRLTAFLSRLQ